MSDEHLSELSAQKRELVSFVSSRISKSLGADPIPPGVLPGFFENDESVWGSPIGVGSILGVSYIILFCVSPFFYSDPPETLILLSLWGCFYLMFATVTARITSSSILHTLESTIAPNISDDAASRIARELNEVYGGKTPYFIAYSSAAIATIVSSVALYSDVSSTTAIRLSPGGLSTSTDPVILLEIAHCQAGFFFLYLLSAKTTYMARFYGVFSKHLDSERLYGLSPAQSACIKQIESIGIKVLVFWFGIVCSAGSLLVIFANLPWFLTVVVPSASVFSFVFGTVVFLSFEGRIKREVNSASASTLRSLEEDIAELFDRRQSLTSVEWERLGHLSTMHRSVSTTAQYRSTVIGAFSVVAPFVGPAGAFMFERIFGQFAG